MKTYKTEIKWGLIQSAMFLLWMVLERSAGLHDKQIAQQPIVGIFILVPTLIIYLLALMEKRKSYAGHIRFRQAFMTGIRLSLVVVLLSPTYLFIAYYIISPQFFDNAIAWSVKTGRYTEAQAKAQLNFGSYLLVSIVAGLITGTFFSAVLAYFIKNKEQRS